MKREVVTLTVQQLDERARMLRSQRIRRSQAHEPPTLVSPVNTLLPPAPKRVTVEYQEHDRERAVRDVAAFMRSNTHSNLGTRAQHADRECAFALIDYFEITSFELLQAFCTPWDGNPFTARTR